MTFDFLLRVTYYYVNKVNWEVNEYKGEGAQLRQGLPQVGLKTE